jgi:V/A-type H+-transporting ATPase subunit I
MANCLVISENKIDIPYKEIDAPLLGLKQMKGKLAESYEIIERIKSEIRKYSCYHERFVSIKGAFEKELELHEAMRGMGRSNEISYLKGYIPVDQVKAVSEYAAKEKHGIFITDPSEDESIPTLIKNPKWVSIINPVFKLIEIVPGYRELDISLWFLLFLSIFYGMLIGDAGYGVIYLALTGYFHVKLGRRAKNRSVFFLLYVLNISAFIWGVLTGTFFGQDIFSQWVKPLAPALRNDKNVQMLCFLIGVVHLSIAHIWRFITKLPSPKALADIGWVVILWGGFFLANTLVLACGFPPFAKWLFIAGTVLVVLFSDPQKNILKGIGSGLTNFLLSVMNSFTDVVSYIRLFAVGLAGVAVADSFNRMAMDSGFNSILSGFIAALILIVGHTLNIVLGPMSVLVHGIRLNVLEFCSHVDIKWSGFEYKPLKE